MIPNDINTKLIAYRQKLDSLPKHDITCYSTTYTFPRGYHQCIINGNIDCENTHIDTLLGMPLLIGGNYIVKGNKNLKSLKHSPIYVGGSVTIVRNKLESLEGIPRYIDGSLHLFETKVQSFHDIHTMIEYISENFNIVAVARQHHYNVTNLLGLMMIYIGGSISTGQGNYIKNLGITDVDLILNKWKNQGRRGVMGAMKELSDLGYEELAQL